MKAPGNAVGEDGFRLGLWIVIWGTMGALLVGAPVLSFGMPAARIFLWGVAIVLPVGASVALKKKRLRLAFFTILPASLIILGPLLAFFTLVVCAASKYTVVGAVTADILIFLLLWIGARRVGKGLLIAYPVLLMLVHLVVAGGVLYKLYRIPAPGVCDALADQEGVVRAARDYGSGLAHQSLLLGDTDHVAATFKVDRDVLLLGLGEGEGNTLAVFSSDGLTVGAAPISPPVELPKGQMPQFMLYDSKGRLVFTVTSILDGQHKLGIIERPLDATLKVDHWIELPRHFEPNAILEDEGDYIVFALHAEVLRFNSQTLEAVEHWVRPDGNWVKGRVVLSMRPGGEGLTYLATLGFYVIEHNIRSRENRRLQIPWGGAGGVLRILEGKNEIVVVDMVFHNLIFIDQDSFEITRVLDLDFGPRAIAWDPQRELLFVGEYIAGRVHSFRYADLAPVGPPVEVGENLRSFTYDHKRSLLLASSKCGLIGLDAAILEGEAQP